MNVNCAMNGAWDDFFRLVSYLVGAIMSGDLAIVTGINSLDVT